MKKIIFSCLIELLILFTLPTQSFAENTALNIYMDDFQSKSNKASQILRDIETSLKEGSRKKVCLRQREAARLGLLANKSLIKAFKIEGIKPPMKAIKANQQRWESILNEC